MKTLLKSSFTWQFAIGFALGALGLATFHAHEPADASVNAVPAAVTSTLVR